MTWNTKNGLAGVEPVGYILNSRMENTPGLNVHGSTPSQPESQPNDTSNPIASSHVQWNNDDHAPEEGNATFPKSDDKSRKEKGKDVTSRADWAHGKDMASEWEDQRKVWACKSREEAFNTSVAFNCAKQAANHKVQLQINWNREQNTKRKPENMSNKEWDSWKQGGKWKQGKGGKGNLFSPGFVQPQDREGPPTNHKSTSENHSSSAACIAHGSGSASSQTDLKEGGQE